MFSSAGALASKQTKSPSTDSPVANQKSAPDEKVDLEEYWKKQVETMTRVYGPDSREATDAEYRCLQVLKDKNKDLEALAICRRVVTKYQKICGSESLQVAGAEDQLARTLRHIKRFSEAEIHQRKALAICEKLCPPGDPQIAQKTQSLAKLLALMPNKSNEARATFLKALDLATKNGDKTESAATAANFAAYLVSQGEPAEARKYLTPVLHEYDQSETKQNLHAAMLMILGQCYSKERDFEEGNKCFARALELFQHYSSSHTGIGLSIKAMADNYIETGDYYRASRDLEKWNQTNIKRPPDRFLRLAQKQQLKMLDVNQRLINKGFAELTPKAIEKYPDGNSTAVLASIYKEQCNKLGQTNAITCETALQLAIELRLLNGSVKPILDKVEPSILAFCQELLKGTQKENSNLELTVKILGGKNKALDFAIDELILLAEMRGEGRASQSAQKDLALAEECLKQRYPESAALKGDTSSQMPLAELLLQIATVWRELGKYNRATELSESAIAIIDNEKTDSKLKYESYLQLGNLNMAEADSNAALTNGRKAETIALKLFGQKSKELIPCYGLMAQIELALGENKKAEEFTKKALNCSGLTRSDRIALLDTRGFSYLAQGRYEEAKATFDDVLQMHDESEKNLKEEMFLYTSASTALAEALVNLGKPDEALVNLDWSLNIDKGETPDELQASARDAAGIATVHAINGQAELAADYALLSADYADKFLQNGFSQLSFAQQCSFVNITHQIRSVLLQTCYEPEQLAKAYQYIIKWKGLLLETLRSQSAVSTASIGATESTKAAIADLSAIREKLGELANGGKSESSEFLSLTEKKERIERQLSQLSNAQEISDVIGKHDIAWFKNLLQPDEAFFDILTYTSIKDNADHYALIVLKPSEQNLIRMFDLGQTKTIDDQISSWRGNVMQQLPGSQNEKLVSRDVHVDSQDNHAMLTPEEYMKLTQKLAGLFITNPELATFLGPATTRVWLCSEGAVTRMPWNSLGTICGARKFDICEIDSPREFAQISLRRNSKDAMGRMLLAGVGAFHDSEFSDLPGTEKEINAIQKEAVEAGVKFDILLDEKANKTNVKNKIANASVVHVSTHGFARGDSTSGAKETRSTIHFGLMSLSPTIARNPLTDSGLVLSSGSTRNGGGGGSSSKFKQDTLALADNGPKWRSASGSNAISNERTLKNLLTAEEIVGLNLKNCKLVTLSACKTGLGTGLSGQGVLGLRSAILASGARSILMSLWSVDDDATEKLMQKFYEYLLDPNDPLPELKALEKAQEYIRNQPQWQSPNYWAGWIIAGDGWQTIRSH